MLMIIGWLRKFAQAIASQARPWQIGLASGLGLLLGLLDWWMLPGGINSLVVIGLIVLLWFNMHLGSGMLFMGIGAVIQLALGATLEPLAVHMVPLATTMAQQPIAYALHLSHTGNIVTLIYGVPLALLVGYLAYRVSNYFQTKLQEKLAERKKLVKAGKTASNPWVLRITCWFLDIS